MSTRSWILASCHTAAACLFALPSWGASGGSNSARPTGPGGAPSSGHPAKPAAQGQLPKGVAAVTAVEGIQEFRLDNGLRVLLFPATSSVHGRRTTARPGWRT
jgi:hypothetical protein